jgi:hypothetical protein
LSFARGYAYLTAAHADEFPGEAKAWEGVDGDFLRAGRDTRAGHCEGDRADGDAARRSPAGDAS